MVVGDRIFTDVVLANRMWQRPAADVEKRGPLAVWTTGVWQKESMMVRWMEKRVVDMVARWTDTHFQGAFTRPVVVVPEETVLSRVLKVVRRK